MVSFVRDELKSYKERERKQEIQKMFCFLKLYVYFSCVSCYVLASMEYWPYLGGKYASFLNIVFLWLLF